MLRKGRLASGQREILGCFLTHLNSSSLLPPSGGVYHCLHIAADLQQQCRSHHRDCDSFQHMSRSADRRRKGRFILFCEMSLTSHAALNDNRCDRSGQLVPRQAGMCITSYRLRIPPSALLSNTSEAASVPHCHLRPKQRCTCRL